MKPGAFVNEFPEHMCVFLLEQNKYGYKDNFPPTLLLSEQS